MKQLSVVSSSFSVRHCCLNQQQPVCFVDFDFWRDVRLERNRDQKRYRKFRGSFCGRMIRQNNFMANRGHAGLPRVREMSGKNEIFSRSGKSQGILKKCQGILAI